MATIVQNYGPIYGEVVNGTVQGRPNGSVYVPVSNTISIASKDNYIKFYSGSLYVICNSSGTVLGGGLSAVAVSQDLASNIRFTLYSDAALITQVGTAVNESAGIFNVNRTFVSTDSSDNLTAGNTYYLVGELMNSGVPVATSNVLQLVAV